MVERRPRFEGSNILLVSGEEEGNIVLGVAGVVRRCLRLDLFICSLALSLLSLSLSNLLSIPSLFSSLLVLLLCLLVLLLSSLSSMGLLGCQNGAFGLGKQRGNNGH
jgi:hypothetical protein